MGQGGRGFHGLGFTSGESYQSLRASGAAMILFFNLRKAKPLFRGEAGRGSEIPSCKSILPHAPTAARIPLKRLSPWANIGLAYAAAGVPRTSTRSAFQVTSFWISSKICNISDLSAHPNITSNSTCESEFNNFAPDGRRLHRSRGLLT